MQGKQKHKTKLFPPTGSLEYITIDLLGPFPMTKNGNQFIAFITDRYSKITRALPMRKMTDPLMAAMLLKNWILPYCILSMILSDNDPQFIAEFLEDDLPTNGNKPQDDHRLPPTNERPCRELQQDDFSRLPHYVSEHQND